MWRLIACGLLAVALPVHAATRHLTAYSTTDDQSTNKDVLGFLEHGTDSAIGSCTTRVYNAANRGHDGIRRSLCASLAASATRSYYTLATSPVSQIFSPAILTGSMRRAVNVATAPGTGTVSELFGTLEASGSDPGLCADVDENRALVLKYGSGGQTIGTSANGVLSDLACTKGYSFAGHQLPCTVATVSTDCPTVCSGSPDHVCVTTADCPGGQTCGADTCTDFYFANVEISWAVNGTTQLTATARVNGSVVIPQTAATISGGAGVVDLFDGPSGLCGGTGALTAYYASGKVTDTERAYAGYIVPLGPSLVGAVNQWGVNGAGTHVTVLDDYVVSPYEYDTGSSTSNTVSTTGTNKVEEFGALTPEVTLGAGERVESVGAFALGRTSNPSADRTLGMSVRICPTSTTCSAGAAISLFDLTTASSITTPSLLASLFANAPTGLVGVTDWTGLHNDLGWRVRTGATQDGTTHVGAFAVLLDVVRNDTPFAQTLTIHNVGENEQDNVCWLLGDSTAGGSFEGECSEDATNAGEACLVNTTCSWNAQKDIACGEDADCQVCDADKTTPCADSSDCGGGTCLSSATCDEVCPGGECLAEKVGWPANFAGNVPCDVIVQCPFGGQDSLQRLAFMPDIINGRFLNAFGACPSGRFVQGTGRCECTSNAECQTTSGGLCEDLDGDGIKTCTTSDNGRDACTTDDPDGAGPQPRVCATSRACVAKPHVFVFLYGYNDVATFPNPGPSGQGAFHDPQCSLGLPGIGAATPPLWCPQVTAGANPATDYACPETFCDEDSDGSHVGPCVGVRLDTSREPCRTNVGAVGCTMRSNACGTADDCEITGQTCDGGDPALPQLKIGTCRCASDAECPSGHHCVGPTGEKVCRKACDGGGSCGSAGSTCDTTTCDATFCDQAGDDFCTGLKACPCDAITCSDDTDCGGYTDTSRFGGKRSRFYQGTCNPETSTCANCGTYLCREESAWSAGCSCGADGDCGGGGDCQAGVCVAGDADRIACRTDAACATGERCMSGWRQLNQGWLAGHANPEPAVAGLVRETKRLISTRMQQLGDTDGGPIVFAYVPPLPGGWEESGFTPALDCSGGFQADMQYYQDVGDALATVLPAHRIIHPGEFNQARTAGESKRVHGVGVHYTPTGSLLVAEAGIERFNSVNACVLDADPLTPQQYCQNLNGSWQDTACSGLPCTCSDTSPCASGNCSVRPCNRDEAECPAAGDHCGPE